MTCHMDATRIRSPPIIEVRRVQALNEALDARMRLMGESEVLSSFAEFFNERELTSGTQVLLLWRTADSTLEIKLLPSAAVEYASVRTPHC